MAEKKIFFSAFANYIFMFNTFNWFNKTKNPDCSELVVDFSIMQKSSLSSIELKYSKKRVFVKFLIYGITFFYLTKTVSPSPIFLLPSTTTSSPNCNPSIISTSVSFKTPVFTMIFLALFNICHFL